MVMPDTTVTEIVLAPRVTIREGIVVITIFKNPDAALGYSAAAAARDSADLANHASPIGFGTEKVSVPGATEAYVTSGPFGSGCQLVAQLPDRTIVNVSSEASPARNGTTPLDRQEVEQLVGFILETR